MQLSVLRLQWYPQSFVDRIWTRSAWLGCISSDIHKPRLKKDSYELWFTNNYHFQEPYHNLTYSKPKFEPHLKTQPTNKTKSSALQMFIQMRKSTSRGALHRTAKTIISAAAAEFEIESVTQQSVPTTTERHHHRRRQPRTSRELIKLFQWRAHSAIRRRCKMDRNLYPVCVLCEGPASRSAYITMRHAVAASPFFVVGRVCL